MSDTTPAAPAGPVQPTCDADDAEQALNDMADLSESFEKEAARLRAENAALAKAVDRAAAGAICGLCLASIEGYDTTTLEKNLAESRADAATLREKLAEAGDQLTALSRVTNDHMTAAMHAEQQLAETTKLLHERIEECRRVEAKFSSESDAFIAAASERGALQIILRSLEAP